MSMCCSARRTELQLDFHQRNVYLDHSCGLRNRVSASASAHWRSLTLEKNPIYMLNSTCVMSPMECGLGSFLLTVAIKTVSAHSRLLGWVSLQVLSRTLVTSVVAGVLNEVRQSRMHASFSVFDCDECSERKLLSFCNTYTFTSRRKSGRLLIDLSMMEKRAAKCRLVLMSQRRRCLDKSVQCS